MKTSELTGTALDWAAAKADENLFPAGDVRLIDGGVIIIHAGGHEEADHWSRYSPSTDWALAGPIIEREQIGVGYTTEGGETWLAAMTDDPFYISGPTALVAAMRCYVASKLGDDVELPEELI